MKVNKDVCLLVAAQLTAATIGGMPIPQDSSGLIVNKPSSMQDRINQTWTIFNAFYNQLADDANRTTGDHAFPDVRQCDGPPLISLPSL